MRRFISSRWFSEVLEFDVAGFRQQQTETSSDYGDDAVYQHGDGVMVNVQESDQWSEDARHTSTHGVQTNTVLSTGINNGLISNLMSSNLGKLWCIITYFMFYL